MRQDKQTRQHISSLYQSGFAMVAVAYSSSAALIPAALPKAPNILVFRPSPRSHVAPASRLRSDKGRLRIFAFSSPALGTSDDAVPKIKSLDVVGENDLLIVGPGVLGRMVAEQWQQEHPSCQIYGQTMTPDHHDELVKVGINPSLRGTKYTYKFPYIIFCAPPSQSADYPGDVRLAASNWSGEGCFLFTSSTAAYDVSDNRLCNEDSPVVPLGRNPRTDLLLQAENAVLEVGGCVLRLAGLYKLDRGAHNYWLEKGTVDSRPDHIVNLIHYEDAASLSVAILKRKLCRRVVLGCDNHPVSRQEMMDAVNQSGKFGKRFLGFTGTDGPLGKRIYNQRTRAEISWEPKYPSFRQFLGLTD